MNVLQLLRVSSHLFQKWLNELFRTLQLYIETIKAVRLRSEICRMRGNTLLITREEDFLYPEKNEILFHVISLLEIKVPARTIKGSLACPHRRTAFSSW